MGRGIFMPETAVPEPNESGRSRRASGDMGANRPERSSRPGESDPWKGDAVSVIGYARVSTDDQTLVTQIDALAEAGCDRTFHEKASGAQADRPELAAALDYLRPGDTFVVWRLDRLGRNLGHLIEVVDGLRTAGVEFRSVTEGIDTSTPTGRLVFHIFGAFAEFERELTKERTRETLASKRAHGAQIGRRTAITPDRLAEAQRMLDSGDYSITSIARVLGVGRSTLYRALAEGLVR